MGIIGLLFLSLNLMVVGVLRVGKGVGSAVSFWSGTFSESVSTRSGVTCVWLDDLSDSSGSSDQEERDQKNG
jgi:hypothetical protein